LLNNRLISTTVSWPPRSCIYRFGALRPHVICFRERHCLRVLRHGGADLHGAMIVTMIAVRMVKFAIDEVIDVVAVWHCLMAAAGAMFVLRIMPRLVGEVMTPVGIRFRDRKDVVLLLVAFLMTKMTILQEIDVAIVFDRRMTTVGTV